MTRNARRRVALLAAAATMLGCSPAGAPQGDAAAAVLAADRAWAAAASSGDLETSVAAMAEDGIMFPPGAPPVVGRSAIRQYMQEAMAIPGFSVAWETDTVVVAASGELAYTTGRSRFTFPDSTGGVDTSHAKAVAVWRRDPDGTWRAILDIWNDAPPGMDRILPVAR